VNVLIPSVNFVDYFLSVPVLSQPRLIF